MSDDGTVIAELPDPRPTSGTRQLKDLIVVANRGPVNVHLADDGTLTAGHGSGGLAPSLARALRGRGALWIASAISEAEHRLARGDALGGGEGTLEFDYVEFGAQMLNDAYNVISNQTLWYLHHGMFDHVREPVFDASWHGAWRHYRDYNAVFAASVAARAAHGATVIVNDYHLSLVGLELRRTRPDLKTVHFTHTPFATPEELSILPSAIADELLTGLCSYGAIGFHAERWRERATTAARDRLGLVPDSFVAPLGSDPVELDAVVSSADVGMARDEIRRRTGGRRLIVRSDRIEPSKNIVRGILAVAELLESSPSLASEVRVIIRAYASRTALADYLAYGEEISNLVERVNDRFRDLAGGEVIELDTGDDFVASIAALSLYDVLLVNPIRDGMNLVAKEGPIVNTNDGVLVLSREAGAFAELGAHALAVDPFDVSMTAGAIATALSMPRDERVRHADALRTAASALPPSAWLDAVLTHARPPVG